MPLETIVVNPGAAPDATIIVLHGLGADATDFLSIARQLDLSSVATVRYVFPNAPVRPVTINNGMQMRAWYDVFGFGETLRREDEPGLRASAVEVQALIDREIASGIPSSRIVLGGFSQGCAMSLLAGLRAPQRLAGLLGMSGYLPIASTTAAERSAANRDVPVFLGHGTRDGVIPIGFSAASRDALVGLGHEVEWHSYPMEHSVSQEELGDIEAWLRKVLARPA